jgi:glutathione-regulated potassium-efflux system protein KefB
MAVEGQASELVRVVVLLAASVVAVPIFRRLGLGSVLGYLAAGLVIGPYGLQLFTDPGAILHVAELGVVMFLFVIGLEMRPSHLWQMRRQIFGLGVLQLVACGLLLTAAGVIVGLRPVVAFIGAMGLAMTSTAIVMQILEERGDVSTPRGQRVVSILLLEDLAIVPLLAFVAFVAPASRDDGVNWIEIAIGIGSLVALMAAGRLLSPMFRVLAAARAREVMTAAALLVVLGAALLMQISGLSMAMGAFVAGVLLSESTFRHQLEADVEPFRGILLGLFFMGVGMSFDVSVFAHSWRWILVGVVVLMLVKAGGIYAIARLTRSTHADALYRAALMAQGSEFAFVLYAAAGSANVIEANVSATLTAIIILSMALTPLCVLSLRWLVRSQGPSMDGVERVDSGVDGARALHGQILIIGFGRFGQVASQTFLARGCDVSIIDTDTDMIRSAADFGFKVYYGDGTRLDVLRAAGAGSVRLIAICTNQRDTTTRVFDLVRAEFPAAKLYVRSYDRGHALELLDRGVTYEQRETFESALAFGRDALQGLGLYPDAARVVADYVRERDLARLEVQRAEGITAGREFIVRKPRPEPVSEPEHAAEPLNQEAEVLIDREAPSG